MILKVYPELAALLGGQAPDLRGQFLRGLGGASGAIGVRQIESVYIAPNTTTLTHQGMDWSWINTYGGNYTEPIHGLTATSWGPKNRNPQLLPYYNNAHDGYINSYTYGIEIPVFHPVNYSMEVKSD